MFFKILLQSKTKARCENKLSQFTIIEAKKMENYNKMTNQNNIF